MSRIILPLLIATGLAGLIFFVKWRQRCPRCRSIWGPKGLRGQLLPNEGYRVDRMCRKCGHTWTDEGHYDSSPS